MINPVLYKALQKVFGSVKIGSLNQPGAYIKPAVQGRFYRHKKVEEKKAYLEVTGWGETYAVNCPVCNDTRQRLCISHLTQCYTEKHGVRRWYFGNLLVCYNEKCHQRNTITGKRGLDNYMRQLGNVSQNLDRLNTKALHQKRNLWEIAPTDIELPPESIAITHEEVPPHVLSYLETRGFDIVPLFQLYGVRYVPAGSLHLPLSQKAVKELTEAGTPPARFREDRLVVPIRFKRCLVGWQARKIGNQSSNKDKYIFNAGAQRNEWLYNLDQAVFHQDVIFPEGMTDVWAVGPQAVAGFGKGLSSSHLELLKILYSYDGCGWLLPDENDPDALGTAKSVCARANDQKVFSHGCHVITGILDGLDPAKFVELNGKAELHDRLRDKGVFICPSEENAVPASA